MAKIASVHVQVERGDFGKTDGEISESRVTSGVR